jgi:hypothetical protein
VITLDDRAELSAPAAQAEPFSQVPSGSAEVGRGTFAELADNGNAAAFFGETLPLKATMAMRLADHPGRAQWIPIKNPMAGALRT